ncbi:hypothetical protein CLOBOL_03075 [Enterocloster bolteae ATCC BAA-613]|uniref:Uncharacterized protein n=1 Tax=Enterocloster bolteae (strain ATCC BAA-613 / DSM 15670 / CCUG 46953 / JCM 12243 / WAL 16351) TaxID=411902 RepID=A8RRR8_ENTBW|nr:hypothetical protein CLOBOL_03075 [Enterocloster bolteae ATCC BAA-613]
MTDAHRRQMDAGAGCPQGDRKKGRKPERIVRLTERNRTGE